MLAAIRRANLWPRHLHRIYDKLCVKSGTGWKPSMPYLVLTRTHRAVLTACLMLVAIAGAAIAGPLEDAEAAYDKDDYKTALQLFRSLSDQGNALAQQRLGLMYERGLGVPRGLRRSGEVLSPRC